MKTEGLTRATMVAHLILQGFEPMWSKANSDYAVVNFQTGASWQRTIIAGRSYATECYGVSDKTNWHAVMWEDLAPALIDLTYQRTMENNHDT